MFFWNSCFFDNPTDVGNLISGSSAFSKCSLNIWKFMVHVLRKPGLENFEHYFASMWDECTCAVVWAFCGITFLWDWNDDFYWSCGRPSFPLSWSLLSGSFHKPLILLHQRADRLKTTITITKEVIFSQYNLKRTDWIRILFGKAVLSSVPSLKLTLTEFISFRPLLKCQGRANCITILTLCNDFL